MTRREADVTVCIPSMAIRKTKLQHALHSVYGQTVHPRKILVAMDRTFAGAAATRNRALNLVTTEYVAFLDDDDELGPLHIELLMEEIQRTNADLVYPWFTVVGGTDPLGAFGKPFDAESIQIANYIPVTVLARTQKVREAGGFVDRVSDGPPCEDWGCWLKMLENDAKFVHLPVRTWVWNHHRGHTGGRVL